MPADHGSPPPFRPGAPDPESLLAAPLGELCERAAAVRDAAYGTRLTFSPKVFVPLTMLCRDRCGYCTFAKAPARLESPYLSLDEVLAIARAGRDAGCHEALFTLGESPETRYPEAATWLDDHGYSSTVDYLAAACRAVLEETGLLPHANAGALSAEELRTPACRLGQPGNDDRVGQPRPRRAPVGAGQGSRPAASPPSRRPERSGSPSPPVSWSGSANHGPTASPPSRRSRPAIAATATSRR